MWFSSCKPSNPLWPFSMMPCYCWALVELTLFFHFNLLSVEIIKLNLAVGKWKTLSHLNISDQCVRSGSPLVKGLDFVKEWQKPVPRRVNKHMSKNKTNGFLSRWALISYIFDVLLFYFSKGNWKRKTFAKHNVEKTSKKKILQKIIL